MNEEEGNKNENSEAESKNNNTKPKKNIFTQIKFSDWIITICTLVIAITTYLQWETLRDQLKILQEQLKSTTDELHRSHRPWVSIKGNMNIIEPLTFGPDGIYLKIAPYVLINKGNSPAINVGVCINMQIFPGVYDPEAFKPCLDYSKSVTDIAGTFIMPEGFIQLPEKKVIISGNFVPENIVNLSVFLKICIGYQDEFGIHHTNPFVFEYVIDKGSISRGNKVINGHFRLFPVTGEKAT